MIWTSAIDKKLDALLNVLGRTRLASLWVNFFLLNSSRHLPIALPFRMLVQRYLHEVGPDRQRGVRARQTELLALVKPDPHQANEVRRVTREPAVA